MFPVNTELIAMIARQQLDGIVSGKAPDGFVITEKTETRILLAPSEIPQIPDTVINAVRVSVTYKGVNIILSHGI